MSSTRPGAGPFYGVASSTSGAHTESPVTPPKYGLSYQFDSALVYASASKGFRPGGSQTPAAANVCGPDLRALGLASNPSQYDSDSLWSYELGTKLQFLDNSLHVDASVNAEYDQHLFSGYDGFIRLDERHQSSCRTPDPTLYGYDPGLPPLPEQKQLNVKAGVRIESFELSLFANNAHSLLALTHDAIGSPLYYGIAQTPRTTGIVGNCRY